jgi:hypothetical protein
MFYTKLAADGSDLPADATDHKAVRVVNTLPGHSMHSLIVTAHKAPEEMKWEDAKKWAESLDINGWSWRLPTVEEAMLIPDRSKYPAIDVSFFPDFEGYEWIWTSTPDAEDPSDDAWFVYLHVGHVFRGTQTNRRYVRAVRAGQF